MRVKTERLALAGVVRGKGALEVLERRSVVHFGVAVGGVPGPICSASARTEHTTISLTARDPSGEHQHPGVRRRTHT